MASWTHKKASVIRRFVSDALILGTGGIVLLMFRLLGKPNKRGFFCDDQTLMYPYHPSTVSSGMLYGIGFALGFVLMVIVEALWVYKFSSKKSGPHLDIATYGHVPVLVRDVYLSFIPFAFGAVIEHVITDIGKYSIGRLRPHFFDVCKPNMTQINCSDGYIQDFQCTSHEANLVREMRLSFPSGHASFSTFVAVYLIIYLQRRLTFMFKSLIRALLQMLIFSLAWYTCLSRVTDNKHHPTDVLAGAIIGIVVASLFAYCVSDLFDSAEVTRETERKQYGSMKQNHDQPVTGSHSPSTNRTTYF